MKYHGIGGVKKTVCTAEQKIAYNLAHSYKYFIANAYNKVFMGCEKSYIIRKSCYDLVGVLQRDYPASKYDIDAVFCCLGAGLEEYIKSGGRILWSYEDIGSAFPALYLDEVGGSAT